MSQTGGFMGTQGTSTKEYTSSHTAAVPLPSRYSQRGVLSLPGWAISRTVSLAGIVITYRVISPVCRDSVIYPSAQALNALLCG